MASDFNKPVVADAYATLLPAVVTMFSDLVKQLEPTDSGTSTNVPTNAIRWNKATSLWEKWNGSTWAALATTYGIAITGNAGTVSNGVYSTGSYANPAWITSLAGTKVSGNISGNAGTATSATTATTATHLAGGLVGQVSYQTAAGSTAMLAAGTAGQVLQTNGAAAPSWVTALASIITATTAAVKNATTLLATTAFVDRLRSLLSSAVTSGAISITDRGSLVLATAGVTIPNSTFAAGDVVTIYNNSASAFTITASITTLRQVGTVNTGNRTLAARGLCTVTFISATEAVIGGGGVT